MSIPADEVVAALNGLPDGWVLKPTDGYGSTAKGSGFRVQAFGDTALHLIGNCEAVDLAGIAARVANAERSLA